MDLKHSMLYGELDATGISQQAQADIGLPMASTHEPPPPSYDEAISPYPNLSRHSSMVHPAATTRTHSNAGFTSPTAPELILTASNSPISPKSKTSYDYTTTTTAHTVRPDYHISMMQDQQQHAIPAEMTITVQPGRVATTELPNLGPHPCKVTCPSCGTARTTRVNYTPNSRTHLSAMILCLVGWCCCACVVPYCMDSCRTGNHYCAKCNTYLGAYTHARQRRRRR